MNLSAVFHAVKLLANPSLCLPHHTISTFDQLPIPLSSALTGSTARRADIRAVVLDKDNCFAAPDADDTHASCRATLARLRRTYPGSRLLIVSNSAGAGGSAAAEAAAARLERNTGVAVLRHATPKPGCHGAVMAWLLRGEKGDGAPPVTSAAQVAVVGDRLLTDVMMANAMGAHAVWVREGVVPDRGVVSIGGEGWDGGG